MYKFMCSCIFVLYCFSRYIYTYFFVHMYFCVCIFSYLHPSIYLHFCLHEYIIWPADWYWLIWLEAAIAPLSGLVPCQLLVLRMPRDAKLFGTRVSWFSACTNILKPDVEMARCWDGWNLFCHSWWVFTVFCPGYRTLLLRTHVSWHFCVVVGVCAVSNTQALSKGGNFGQNRGAPVGGKEPIR